MKKPTRKPTKRPTVSIKQHLTDNGYPDAHKLKSDERYNTFTDKDGTTYKWKVGEKPTEKDIVPADNTPPPTPPWTDNEVTGY